jgi:hypothetical protein
MPLNNANELGAEVKEHVNSEQTAPKRDAVGESRNHASNSKMPICA